jgi:predicted small metal-binding protein
MAYVINCDCGYTARGETEDELLADAQRHIQSDHPEIAGEMTRERILEMAEQQ